MLLKRQARWLDPLQGHSSQLTISSKSILFSIFCNTHEQSEIEIITNNWKDVMWKRRVALVSWQSHWSKWFSFAIFHDNGITQNHLPTRAKLKTHLVSSFEIDERLSAEIAKMREDTQVIVPDYQITWIKKHRKLSEKAKRTTTDSWTCC